MSLTQDEIIRMAREAGFVVQIHGECFGHTTLEHRFNPDRLEAFAALVAAYEREAIMDEWWMCVDSDLENGVKSLNERAAKKWHEEYPAISGFGEAIRERGEK